MIPLSHDPPPNAQVQDIAKEVLARCREAISPDATEQSIAAFAVRQLAGHGVTQTWYYDCPALVLLGRRSCLSVSGRDYRPTDEPVGAHNLVTIDLSPSLNGTWGDCARSCVVEDGRVVDQPADEQFRRGLKALHDLHSLVQSQLTPQMRFCDLHRTANDAVLEQGFENLDYLGNVGHSIGHVLSDRIFADQDSTARLDSVPAFTFEPHIRQRGGQWGFKHEEIYYFDGDGCLAVL